MKITIVLLFLFINAFDCYGQMQGIRNIGVVTTPDKSKKDNRILGGNKVKYVYQERNVASLNFDLDYVLYRDVVRCYTWLVGVGDPISQSEANNLPYYYRLSMKNEQGHYHLVEAMHGRHLTTEHPLSTYILDKSDNTEYNTEWKERLKKVGKWAFYSDIAGENVVEERAFEAKEENASLIYSMLPVITDSNHVTISYLDAMGYPADMNENDDFTYGSVVRITYDSRGYDSVIDFLDGAGYRKTNTDGVDQQRYIYDDKGRVLLATSNNCIGDPVVDNWGNCGVKFTYNDADNSYKITYLDSNLSPMRMPSDRAGAEDTFVCCLIKKDKFGRKAESIMTDEFGNNDTTLSGIHRIVYNYTNDGQVSIEYFDLDNKKIKM